MAKSLLVGRNFVSGVFSGCSTHP